MLSPLKDLLKGYKMVLASTSVQRKAIWQQMGIEYTAVASSFDEDGVDQRQFAAPEAFVQHLAKGKALAVVDKLKCDGESNRSVVVGADTVIVVGGTIVGKPHTASNAIQTLERLSGKTHRVVTGVAILVIESGSVCLQDTFVSSTDVAFSNLTTELIQSYVETGEPLNKAGAYGIQGLGSRLVEGISGDYYNVVGFPINKFCERLEALLKTKSVS